MNEEPKGRDGTSVKCTSALLNIRQFQEYVGLTRKESRRILHDPECPFAIRLGKSVYANRKALEEWLANNTGRQNE